MTRRFTEAELETIIRSITRETERMERRSPAEILALVRTASQLPELAFLTELGLSEATDRTVLLVVAVAIKGVVEFGRLDSIEMLRQLHPDPAVAEDARDKLAAMSEFPFEEFPFEEE